MFSNVHKSKNPCLKFRCKFRIYNLTFAEYFQKDVVLR